MRFIFLEQCAPTKGFSSGSVKSEDSPFIIGKRNKYLLKNEVGGGIKMFLFWMQKESGYSVPKHRRRPFLFWRPPPNSSDHLHLRSGWSEREITKRLLLKLLFCSTNNGNKTMLIAH